MKHSQTILNLQSALHANGGIMPPEWQPYAEILQLLLQFAKAFTNPEFDKIIDELIAAIELAQQL